MPSFEGRFCPLLVLLLTLFRVNDNLGAAAAKRCNMNIVIVVDVSGSACTNNASAREDLQIVIEAVAKLIEYIGNDLLSGQSRAAVLSFNDNIVETIDSINYDSTEKFVDSVRHLNCTDGGTNIRNGITQALDHFKEYDGKATTASKAMLVITDGQDNTDAASARQLANDQQIAVYVAGFERYDDNAEYLQEVAGDQKHLLSLENLTQILDATCTDHNVFLKWTTQEKQDFESPIATAKPGSSSFATVEESITISKPVSNTDGESSSAEKNVEVQNAPQKCACDLHGAWLDIVLVFDSSKAISRQDFRALTQGIASLVKQMSVSQMNGKYSRIAIVKMNERAERVANLSSFNDSNAAANEIKNLVQSNRKNGTNGHDETVNVAAGLLEAQNILRERRPNVKGLVILFSSKDVPCHTNSYRRRKRSALEDEDPCRVAELIKNERNTLATIALKFGKVKTYPAINISNPCYRINSDLKFLANIKKLICNANCFCLDPYVQFKDKDECQFYSECIYLQSIPNDYHSASDTCRAYNSTLVDIFNERKDDFIRKLHESAELAPYWIGLNNETGKSVWNSGKELQQHDYTNWAPAYPDETLGKCVFVDLRQGSALWKSENCISLEASKYFSCQKASCDTDNYCDFSI